MRVLIDDALVEISEPTLAAALEHARRAAQAQNRVVVEATIDGLTIPDAMLAEPSEMDLGSSEVRFTTADPGALVRATFRDVSGLLEQAKRDQTSAGELVQTGDLRGAMEKLSAALGVWDTVQQAVSNGAALMGVDPKDLRVALDSGAASATGGAGAGGDGGESVADAVSGLAHRLTDVKRSISAQDWAGLSDALLYDMNDQADRWRVLLDRLGERLAGG